MFLAWFKVYFKGAFSVHLICRVAQNISTLFKTDLTTISFSAGQHKSVIFDGLDEDDDPNVSKNSTPVDIFVPRKSIKKLIIHPKSPSIKTFHCFILFFLVLGHFVQVNMSGVLFIEVSC